MGFDKVFWQRIRSGFGVRDSVDKAHVSRGQAETKGNLLILFRKQGDAVGIFKRANLCIRFLRSFSVIDLFSLGVVWSLLLLLRDAFHSSSLCFGEIMRLTFF